MSSPGGSAAAVWVAVLPDLSNFGATLTRDMAGVGGDAGARLGDDMARSTESSFSKGTKVIAAAGAAIGVALGVALVGAMNVEAANDKLAAQLGLSADQAQRYGKVAGDLYSSNYGDSLETVNEALRQVTQNVGATATSSDESLKSITASVLDVATAFDQDLGGVTVAVGQLMRTGLAPDAKSALDIITAGFQAGVDKSGDFLDTLNEYGTQFRKLGLDGATATGILRQGLEAGARDADLVADALKEFSIRAVDGSKLTAEGFKQLGLDGELMGRNIARGGDFANEALSVTLDALRGISDPAQRSAAAVALFGTQAEDLGAALLALDPTTAVGWLGEVGGAAERMGKTLSDNAGANLESFKRQMITAFVDIVGGQILPVVQNVARFLATVLGPALTALGSFLASVVVPALRDFGEWIQRNRAWLEPLAVGLTVFTIAINAQTIAIVAWGVVTRAVSIVAGLWTAAQWLLNAAMAANPIGLVIAVIAGLVAAFIWAWNNSEDFRNIVTGTWAAIRDTAVAVFTAVRDFIVSVWTAVADFFTSTWNNIANFATSVWGAIGNFFTGLWTGVRDTAVGVWNAIGGFFSTIWNFIAGVATTVWNAVTDYFVRLFHAHEDLIMGVWNAISGFFTTIWNFIAGVATTVWNAIASFFTTIWNAIAAVFTAVWTAISDTATTVWNAISAFFTAAFALFQATWNLLWDTVSTIFRTVWDAISNTAVSVWNAIVGFFTPSFNAFSSFFSSTWDAISAVFSAVWNAISSTAQTVWGSISSFFTGAFNGFVSFFTTVWNSITGVFESVWNRIRDIASTVWDGITSVFRTGVNAVIDVINWLADKVNIVLKFLLIPEIPAIPRLETGGILGPQLLAAGGRVGHGFVTNGPQAIVGEGNPKHPEYVIPTDPKYRNRAVALYNALGAQLMADGGILGWIGDVAGGAWKGITSAASAVGGAIGDVASWVGGGVSRLIDEITGAIRSMLPGGVMGEIGMGIGKKAIEAIKEMITKAFAAKQAADAAAIGGGAAPPGQISAWIAEALAILGWPENYAAGIYQQIMTESGGDPGVTQHGYVDVNTLSGNLAQGIMQVIPPTFAAYKLPGHDNPFNAVDNIIAGSRYAMARYGAGWFEPGPQHSHGYDAGGLAAGPGWMRKDTLSPERVLSPRQTVAFEQLVNGLLTQSAPSSLADERLNSKLDDLLELLRSQRPIVVEAKEPVETGRAVQLALLT